MQTNPDHGQIYGDKLLTRVSSVPHPDNFNRNVEDASESGTISDPARYYLHGAHFEKVLFDLALPYQKYQFFKIKRPGLLDHNNIYLILKVIISRLNL